MMKEEEEEAEKKFLKRLDKWDSYKRGDWRWSDRPIHRDLTITLIRGGDAMGKLLKDDLSALNETDDCMRAMNDFVANGGHNEKQDVPMPLPVSPGACLKMKRQVQEKINKKEEVVVIVPASEPAVATTSNVEFIGEDVFLTSAPYVDEENNDENNNNVVIDHESDSGNHCSNMLLVVKRHNNFRLRKKELLKQQHTTTTRTIDTTSDEIADSLSQLVGDRTSSSSPPLVAQSSSLAVPQSMTPPRSPLAELIRGQSLRHQTKVTSSDTSSSSASHHADTPNDKSSSSSKIHQPEEPQSCEQQPRQQQQQQQRDRRRSSGGGTGSGDDDAAATRATESYGEDLLRDAEMRMYALGYCREDDGEELLSQRVRQQHRLAQEVEHDLQHYDRKIPDIKAAQHSWQYAKKAHALASERQALLDAARTARLEADRLAKVEAKATAQLEALKRFVEMKETKLKKARKNRTVRRRSEDNGGDETMDVDEPPPRQDDEGVTADDAVPKKMLARSKSAYTHKCGDDRRLHSDRPTWLQPTGTSAIGAASDDSRVEYQGVMHRTTTTTATSSSSSSSNAHIKPELGCGEKWLAAIMAERKAAATAAAAAVATQETTPSDIKEAKNAPPVLTRRQSIEIAKEREKEKERTALELVHGKGEKKGKKGLKKKQSRPSSAADFGLLDDDELELRLAGDTTAVAGVGNKGTTRPNYLQSALSLLSNPATSSYPAVATAAAAATPAPLTLCHPSAIMVSGPPSHFLRHNNNNNFDNHSNHHHHHNNNNNNFDNHNNFDNNPPSSSMAAAPLSTPAVTATVTATATVTRGFRGMGSIDSPGGPGDGGGERGVGVGGGGYFPHFPRATAAAGPPSSIYRPQPQQPPSLSSFRTDGSPSLHPHPTVVMQLIDDAMLLQPTSLAAPPSVPPAPSSSQISPTPAHPASGNRHLASAPIPSAPSPSIEWEDFFDPVSSTADKGRLRLQDPRQFEADSIRCVRDEEKNGVTLVLGRKRRRFNPLDPITTPTTMPSRVDVLSVEASFREDGRQQEVVAVLFDRHVFVTETDARAWWAQNQRRVTAIAATTTTARN